MNVRVGREGEETRWGTLMFLTLLLIKVVLGSLDLAKRCTLISNPDTHTHTQHTLSVCFALIVNTRLPSAQLTHDMVHLFTHLSGSVCVCVFVCVCVSAHAVCVFLVG